MPRARSRLPIAYLSGGVRRGIMSHAHAPRTRTHVAFVCSGRWSMYQPLGTVEAPFPHAAGESAALLWPRIASLRRVRVAGGMPAAVLGRARPHRGASSAFGVTGLSLAHRMISQSTPWPTPP